MYIRTFTYILAEDNFIEVNNTTCFGLVDHLYAWLYIIKKTSELH